jgi:uncharacterized SAM-binding protein YcdF (DUF218 family)
MPVMERVDPFLRPMPHRIVFVLGAPNDTQGRLSAIARSRADKALALQREDPRVRITAVGGFGAHFNTTPVPHRDWVHQYLRARGAVVEAGSPADLLSGNTVEDAWMIEAYVQTRGIEGYGVVTSGFHVPRCRTIFGCLAPQRQVEFIAADDPEGLGEEVRAHEARALGQLLAQGGVVVDGVLHPGVVRAEGGN